MVYNRNIENKIKELIDSAENKELYSANETLREALDLTTNFNSYPLDDAPMEIERIKSKIKAYEDILEAYYKVISNSHTDPGCGEILRELKNI